MALNTKASEKMADWMGPVVTLTPTAIITLDSLRLTSQKGKAFITLPAETSTSVDGGTRNRWGMAPILMPKEMNTLVNLKMANHTDTAHIPGA